MDRIKKFLSTTLLGGFLVILPVAILAFVFSWLFNFVTKLIRPLTNLIVAKSDIKGFLAATLVLFIISFVCFFVGFFVRTRLGHFIFIILEKNILKKTPGYSLVKETVAQLFDNKNSPFSSVALAQVYGNQTLVTCFITDRHEDGSYSVFVPTGPNPTSGNIFHLKGKYVHAVDVSVEETMRSIISCGAGSKKLISMYNSKKK
ncbi:MAG: DUF502 domain-containing protein [Candidatus Omnitrophica bacterium]|nr:DUF502 domain-containing protein [Candidatus Omnitrophota bacterium]